MLSRIIRHLRPELQENVPSAIGEPQQEASGTNEVRMKMKRAVGYCMNRGTNDTNGCEDYAKGVFLLNHGPQFYCPRCRDEGMVVKERGFADDISGVFKEVRVEYNYDPLIGRYREIAIVRDDSIWGESSTYTLLSPLIKTEKRALKVAEAILANLQRYSGSFLQGEIPRTSEIIISFDDEKESFQKKLRALSAEWEQSALCKAKESPEDEAASSI